MIVIEWAENTSGGWFAKALYDPATHKFYAFDNDKFDYVEVKEPPKQ